MRVDVSTLAKDAHSVTDVTCGLKSAFAAPRPTLVAVRLVWSIIGVWALMRSLKAGLKPLVVFWNRAVVLR